MEFLLDENALNLELRQIEAVDLVCEVFVTLEQNDLIQKTFVLQQGERRRVPVVMCATEEDLDGLREACEDAEAL